MEGRRRERCRKLANSPPHRKPIFEKIPVFSLRYVNYIKVPSRGSTLL
jgi:hypothetical protein